MLKWLYTFLFVPTPEVSAKGDEKEIIKANIAFVASVISVFNFHALLAYFYEGYGTSIVFYSMYAWGFIGLYYYIRSGKNGSIIFKLMSGWTAVGCIMVGFHRLTFYVFIFAPFVCNQWLPQTGKIKELILNSTVVVLLATFVIIPQIVDTINEIQNLQELKDLMVLNFTVMKFTYFFCILLSVFCLKISAIIVQSDEDKIRREELEIRVKKQQHLILSFSHELNNPIHTIMNNLYELKNQMMNNSQGLSLLDATRSSAYFLSCFINNILDLSKIDKNDLDVNPVPIKLKSFIEDLWGNCSVIIKSNGIKPKLNLEKQISNEQILILDPHRVRQIVYNVINNSIKYTKEGRINLLISLHSAINPQEMNSTATHTEDEDVYGSELFDPNTDLDEGSVRQKYLRLEMQDTGCGIEKDKIKQVFERQDLHESMSSNSLKLGISLWLTKRLITQLNGKISIHSKIGQGTSVIVMFPVTELNPLRLNSHRFIGELQNQSMNSTIKSKQSIAKPKTLAMIVEDVPFNVNIVKNYLIKLDIEIVAVAENGQRAVEMYKNNIERGGPKIDLITMDIEMPVMNGKSATKQIREYEALKNIQGNDQSRIIFVSGNTIKKEIEDCLEKSGEIRGNAFLKKPLQFNEFQTTIDTILDDNGK